MASKPKLPTEKGFYIQKNQLPDPYYENKEDWVDIRKYIADEPMIYLSGKERNIYEGSTSIFSNFPTTLPRSAMDWKTSTKTILLPFVDLQQNNNTVHYLPLKGRYPCIPEGTATNDHGLCEPFHKNAIYNGGSNFNSKGVSDVYKLYLDGTTLCINYSGTTTNPTRIGEYLSNVIIFAQAGGGAGGGKRWVGDQGGGGASGALAFVEVDLLKAGAFSLNTAVSIIVEPTARGQYEADGQDGANIYIKKDDANFVKIGGGGGGKYEGATKDPSGGVGGTIATTGNPDIYGITIVYFLNGGSSGYTDPLYGSFFDCFDGNEILFPYKPTHATTKAQGIQSYWGYDSTGGTDNPASIPHGAGGRGSDIRNRTGHIGGSATFSILYKSSDYQKRF